MPLVYEKDFENGIRLGVWQALESDTFFLEGIRLHTVEEQEIMGLQARKYSEWLSSRYLLHHLTGSDERLVTWKDDRGKPYLEGNVHHISLSHSGKFTAAILSDFETGIDIQVYQNKIQRIVPKFLSAHEQNHLNGPDILTRWHIAWGAKECLFKAYGKGSVDFKTQLLVSDIDMLAGTCQGSIIKHDVHAQYELSFVRLEECILVFIAKEIFKNERNG
ncbi:MAG: 4'-phosphopantetheinyl transferase superfamily protein [Saprospiraceae bacterium]